MPRKICDNQDILTQSWINLDHLPHPGLFATPLYVWINKKAKALDVSIPAHAEYLRQELIGLHEKYNVPLDSKAFEDVSRIVEASWKRWLGYRKSMGMDRKVHAHINESREAVFFNAFFAYFARSYFDKKSFMGSLFRKVDKEGDK